MDVIGMYCVCCILAQEQFHSLGSWAGAQGIIFEFIKITYLTIAVSVTVLFKLVIFISETFLERSSFLYKTGK